MAAEDRTGNLLLDSMAPDERSELLRSSRRRGIRVGEARRGKGDAIETVSFPLSGTLSVVVEQDGERVEAATIGREGAADLHSALGSRVAAQELLSQIEGESIEVDVEVLNEVYGRDASCREILQGYVEAVFAMAAISAACIAIHHVNERCARWLLESHDRVDSDTFELKQEFLAMMLGVHRPSVSIAASTLQATGAISYRRGVITVRDREILESSACSCYETMRFEYSRLVPLK
jgi:CRP-like cAMP-binding protein